MTVKVDALFESRRRRTLHRRRGDRGRRPRPDHHGIEALEIRRLCAVDQYQLDGFSFAGAPIAGWPVIGTGNLTLQFDAAFNSTGTLGLQFANPDLNTSTTVNLLTTGGSANATAVMSAGSLHTLWNGSSFNATLSIVGADLIGNTSLPINPANILSIANNALTIGESANLTLVATDAASGFGNLSQYNFFLVGGPGNATVSPAFTGDATDPTHLTVRVTSLSLPAGSYRIQTTADGTPPANATDTARFALAGNLNVSVSAINYTVASLTYENAPITGWSLFGSGNESITITLANGSTPFKANENVWFGTGQNVTGTKTSDLTLDVKVPYYGGSYTGVPTFQNLSFGGAPNDHTTNGGFQYTNVALSGMSRNSVYVSGGGNLVLNAASPASGFAVGQPVSVVFDDLEGTKTPWSVTATNSTSLTVPVPKLTTGGPGNYAVYVASAAGGNPRASNIENLTVLADPTINTLAVTLLDSTGLTNATSPAIDDFYAYVYGNVGPVGGSLSPGWMTISNTGAVGNSAGGATPWDGMPLSTLTNNFTQNATLTFNLSDTVYNGTRIYLANRANLAAQPAAGFEGWYYDFIEGAFSNSLVFVDTSQVDQFGFPMTLNLSLNATNGSVRSGSSPGLTRQDVIQGYAAAFQGQAGYDLAIVPTNGTGSSSSPTYRVLAPNDLLNAMTAGAAQQSSNWTYSIVPGTGPIPGPAGSYTNWAWLNLSTTDGTSINGTAYPNGSPVTGPFIPAGTVIAEANTSPTATVFKIATYDGRPFTNRSGSQSINASTVVNGDLNNVAIRIQQLNASMRTPGYQALMNTFGPSVYNGNVTGTDPWTDHTLLNTYNAVDLMFQRYKADAWWQEENQPATVLKGDPTTYPQATALYRGVVTNVTYTSIENTTEQYAALVFTDYSTGVANPNLTFSVLYPYFTTNSPANKRDPFDRRVPAPPLWFGQSQTNFDPPSADVFAGAGIFQPGGPLNALGLIPAGDPVSAYNDFGRDVAVALSRGYASTFLATGVALNQTANLPTFAHALGDETRGTWTMPTAVYQSMGGDVAPGMLVSSFLNFGSPMRVTGAPRSVGGTTTIDVVAYVSGAAIDIKPGKRSDNLQFLTLASDGTDYPATMGGGPIPYNLYEAFIQSRGEFAGGVANGTGQNHPVNIDGLGYGYAFSDFMGLSSSISVSADTSPDAPQTQTATLLVTMQPWYDAAGTYDIQAVTFESQSISGWSLFGSGTDTVTIQTTPTSTAFTPSQSYSVSFGGTVATGTAVTANTLNVAVPALVSRWAGDGTSFANLTIAGANTTGNTTFAVLPVDLTTVNPNNGSVLGGANLTLNASSKQRGFGNFADIANLSVGFVIAGTGKLGLNVTGNATSLTLRSPSSPNHTAGNATLGVYATTGLTAPNLASNTLTFRYTPVASSYDIQAVSFAGQNITGWSLFGSGTDNVTITTTESSFAFIPTDTYTVSFGGTNATGLATSANALDVAVPALVSRWAGNGTSFANLTIAGASTTGNATFAVLPVNLTSVSPTDGSVLGGTNLTLNASSKQFGFGSGANVSVGFAIDGSAAAGLNVTGNATSLTLRAPPAPGSVAGNAALGVYATGGLTTQNLASNTLTYTYTAVPVVYDVVAVAFEGQNITGWSLFGSGADNVTITTTGNSSAFVANASYGVSFGGTNATGVATTTNSLRVAVPALVSRWAGDGTSFANLSIAGGNTTGNTSFAVLPVSLTGLSPVNGTVAGNTALTLNASSKQRGFGNVANISVGFALGGTVKPGLAVTGNATSLTLRTPSSPNLAAGNAAVGVYATGSLTPQNLASNTLTYTYVPAAVSYAIQSVSFEGQNIAGWSLFGSGTDNVTITTTAGSTAFVADDSYTVSFGGANVTGTTLAANSLRVRVPSLVSQWQGANASFANLTIAGGATTGNTTFQVLPVNLVGVAPNNAPVEGGRLLNLTASGKQFGFGNATGLGVGLSIHGAATAAGNVTVVDPTTLSLTAPAVGEPGNWTIGVYKSAGLTAANLASNVLPFTYTERSLVFLSGDFNADNLTDVASLLDDGSWQVSFTQAAGNATLATLGAANAWSTAVVWKDWSVLRRGDRDVVVARAASPNVGTWWKLAYDGPTGGSAAGDFSTSMVGAWASPVERWVNIVNGDFDGDGNPDIAGRDAPNGQWWMLANATQAVSPASAAAKNVLMGAWDNGVQWDAALAGNFKGNPGGKDQIVGLTGTTWWISEYAGSGTLTTTAVTSAWSQAQNGTDFLVGNFGGTGRDLIAGKTAAHAWYTVGYDAAVAPANNTPRLLGTWPGGAGVAYANVVTGDFLGTGNATTGIAGLQRSGGTATWQVLQRPSVGSNGTVANFGTWPQSAVAQAFAGYLSSSDLPPSGRTGVLTRTRQGAGMIWQRGASSGTAFAASTVTGYPS